MKILWACDTAPGDEQDHADRELVLPTGMAHVALRLSDTPLRVFDDVQARAPRVVGHAVIGGPRTRFYVRELSANTRSVGAQLHAGALTLLSGVPAHELAGRHTPLDELWGNLASRARERLLEAGSAAQALDCFESLLAERLPKVRGVHPAVAHALARFSITDDIGEVVLECGYSHRRFITLFRDGVGLGPQQYCRVLRLQRVIARASAEPGAALAELAVASGFADQAHLCRDFRELAGISPGRYQRLRPVLPNHVPL